MAASLRRPSFSSRSSCSPDTDDQGACEDDAIWERKGGQCHEKRVVMHQTEEPGRYSAFGGKRHMYILDLPVKDHRIFYCEGQLGGKAIRMAKLVGRNPDMSLEALEEFKKFTERKGLPQDIIIMPVQTESCIPESD
ncbi:odorant-binding protein 2b-like [Equus caballus]|uniref:odorant-binding protein 2b-like n=1 Tax=Equus caballus TaxID=9796 RepID=UPI0038B3A40A